MRAKVITCVTLFILLILGAVPAYAQEVPPLPHAFYGTVKINDAPAPVATQVEARGEGVKTGIEGNPIWTTAVGVYGSPDPLGPKLVVQGDILDGAIITFWINGVKADQTAAWHSGAVTELNLTVTIPTQPPTVTTEEATNITTNSAKLNGNLTSLGTAASVDVSFLWGTSSGIYPNETTPQAMTAAGAFSASLSGLSANTTYYFRAKAVGDGTSHGTEKSFTTRTTPPAGGGGGGGAPDTTPPTISDILASNISETSADISWKTDEKSTSQVEYWSSPSKFSPLDETRVINHLVHLTGLIPGTTYHYKTMSKDAADNLAVSDEHTFTTLGKAPAATFSAGNLSISPSEVNIGETITISVTVTNTGDLAGSYKVTLKINGVVEATKDVTLDAGGSEEVGFTTTKDVAGSYSVEVDGLKGSFTVKEKPAPPPPPPVTPPPVKPPVNWPLIGGIIAGVVVVGLLIFFLARRRAA